MFTLLIDEEVMNLSNKRDRDFSQGQGHMYPTNDHGRGTIGSSSKPASQSRRASVSSIGGVQMPETSSSSSSLQHHGGPPGRHTGHRMSQPGMDREAQSLSSTVPDVGTDVCDNDPAVTSQHNVSRYSRPSSVDNHTMAMAAVTSANAATDNAMETSRAGSTLDAIVSNLHSAAMEMELAPNHDGTEESMESSHGHNNNNGPTNPILNHMPCVPTPTSYTNNTSSNNNNINSPPNTNNSLLLNNNNNGSSLDATSPSNSTSPKACSTPTGMEEDRVVKVEPSEIPSSSGAPATAPAIGLPQMMVSPMANPALDHKAALKMAPVEHVKGGNKKWQCVFCGILVSSKFYLSSHINAVHTRTRIYPCEICGKMFYSHGAQRIHKLRNHWVEKRHKCPFCGQLFVLPFELRQHVQKKHRGQTEVPPPPPPAPEQTQTTN